MGKRQKSCQCEGDEMLEVRKHANELFEVMSLLSEEFGSKVGEIGNVPDVVRKLILHSKGLTELVAKVQQLEDRNLRDADDIQEIARFLAGACSDGSGAISVGGKSLTIDAGRCFTRLADKAERCLSQSVSVNKFAKSLLDSSR
jgi:hypothetical protein